MPAWSTETNRDAAVSRRIVQGAATDSGPPGAPWQGSGTKPDSLTQERVEGFTEWPVLWLGPSFAGYKLQDISRDDVGLIFIYGTCRPDARGRCVPPAQVHSESVCRVRPEEVASVVQAGPLVTLRGGALLQRFTDGHLEIWTGLTRVYISTPVDRTLVDEAVTRLEGLNGLAASYIKGQDLPPPDFSGC